MATTIDDKQNNGEQDDLSFLRTEDFICLNCAITNQNGSNRRMALAAEAFGNKMCFLEDITAENVTPDFPACIFVLEQALSVRALQEVVNTSNTDNTAQQTGYRTLLYGHAVLLRHLQSNMYLTCLSTSTSNDKLAFDVGLQYQSQGESCWWTLHPASKQRSEGEKVRIGDDIILVSVASERYLHIYMTDNSLHRVNASFQQTLWTLAPISSGNIRIKNPGFVHGGDVLRLFHGNMDQCFTLPQAGTSEFPYSIFYESGDVCNHARSLWRLEHLRTRWYGGFMGWNSFVRLRHITSGRYLAVSNGEITVLHRDKATSEAITFILTPTKDDKKSNEIEQDESMAMPTIKYGDTLVYIQHVKSNCWLSYQTYETKKRGVGKVEEKKASLNAEGHMDDCFTIVRAQEEESRSALVIRKSMSLFTKFNRAMDTANASSSVPSSNSGTTTSGGVGTSDTLNSKLTKANRYWQKISLEQILRCLDDLILFFAQPDEGCVHEEKQAKLKALRNRQDLFHEEGMISLVLDTIDKFSETKANKNATSQLFDGCKQQMIDDIFDKLYVLLATMIKGNRNNCSQFAQGNRLDCLVSRLTSNQASRGVLEVLHSVLIDSPEALNMIKERHIQGIISLLDRNGRDPKVLDVLCSLCANNGIAVRTNQNLICENLLPRRDLLLQTHLIDQISCLRPNIMVGVEEGESMYKKWYFEVEIDYTENVGGSPNSNLTPHCRIGWATTEFQPTPEGCDGLSATGIGDDLYSYGFDGVNLWFAGRTKQINTDLFNGFKKGDVIGCLLDLSIPEIWFSLNGLPMKGFFREFNLNGMFFPAISVSPKIGCRFLFGDEHGRFKYGPPEGCAPISQAMVAKQKLRIEQCFTFGEITKNTLYGPLQMHDNIAFTPVPVDTTSVQVPSYFDAVRDKLAENMHELWAMNKIEQGWRYADLRNDLKKLHNCLCQFEMLPREEKQYDINLSMETLKTLLSVGYQILIDSKQDQKRLKFIKLPNSYLQPNGYRPQPLDLSVITLNQKLEDLVEQLAENTHNVWAKERIKSGWTYGITENQAQKRHPYLLPYDKVDETIKKANRETALNTVKTLLAYGYIIEAPTHDVEELIRKRLSGSKKEASHAKLTSRTYRAEKTYAIKSGKWYYEVEVLTSGLVKVGWASETCPADNEIGSDFKSYAFNGHNARKLHHTSDSFGKKWSIGDIVGVMIDLQDRTISYSLNGELLLDSLGCETAFNDIDIDDGYIPAFTLGTGQKVKLNFGQDVNSLKYFTNYGLQEGYEPYCVNMTRQITLWYSKETPLFSQVNANHETIEVIRTNPSQDTPPCMKLISKSFGNVDKIKMEYLRLSLPVTFNDEFLTKATINERRNNALNIYKSQLDEEAENQPQIYNFDTQESTYQNANIDDNSKVGNTLDSQQSATTPSSGNKPLSMLLNKFTHKQMRPKSPFKFMNKISREPSPVTGGGKNQQLQQQQQQQRNNKSSQKTKFARSSEFGLKFIPNAPQSGAQGGPQQILQNAPNTLQLKPAIPSSLAAGRQGSAANFFGNKDPRKSIMPGSADDAYGGLNSDSTYRFLESDDMELQAIMDYVDEYYYGVRVFPGQDPSNVFIGWSTSRFHLSATKFSKQFNSKSMSQCALINTNSDGSIVSNLIRKDCYMISAAELNQYSIDSDLQSAKRISHGLLIGCLVDLSTGVLSFLVNGKEAPQKFFVEPGTKLYPAVFVEPTTKEVLQFELGRIKNCLPLSAALFPSLGKHVLPRCPPRMQLQSLAPKRWARVPNQLLKVHTLKMNNILGWSLLCEENVSTETIYIPEDDRWIDILELNENEDMLKFHYNTLLLYQAVCAQSNNYVAHEVCKQIDEKQLMYCIQNSYLSGQLRTGFHDILIKLHLESYVISRKMTKYEYVIPLTNGLNHNNLMKQRQLIQTGLLPNKDDFVSVRPAIIKEEDVKNPSQRVLLVPPRINTEKLKHYVMTSLLEAIKRGCNHIRDPVGGSNANLFVPLVKLANNLLIMDIFDEHDLKLLMTLLEPTRFADPNLKIEEGLLTMTLDDEVKLELCRLMHSVCDYLLRYRIESIISFTVEFVSNLQADQKKRYLELKEAILPSAIMAKKTKEFRCPARDQMQTLIKFHNGECENTDLDGDIQLCLKNFHELLSSVTRIKDEVKSEHDVVDTSKSKNFFSKLFRVLFFSNYDQLQQEESASELSNALPDASRQGGAFTSDYLSGALNEGLADHSLNRIISETIVKWAKESFIIDQNLIKEMFTLVYRQYNAIGEISDSLDKTYVIGEASTKDVKQLLQQLSTTRSLLCVQMSPCEEEIMKSCLNEIMDNKVFFQHPDLMRALCVHETVMQVMINWLNRRQHQQDMVGDLVNLDPSAVGAQQTGVPSIVLPNQGGGNSSPVSGGGGAVAVAAGEELNKEENTELVVVCCKFLSYFCRTSRHNQRAMFEHLSYLLDNSSMLLARPSLRGSCPLDVACSSLMDNNDLSLALRESHLDKIAVYLSRCGLQTNAELYAKGYPDIGWDPVEGERFLDFLKFCVWVNGDSVEENANLIVRLLIRRPECLGPALRGEGGGLLKATIDGIRMSLQVAATQNSQNPIVVSAVLDAETDNSIDFLNNNKFDFSRIPPEDDEDYIDIGGAILSFYATLVELLGRCAPSEETIKMGKSDSIRARSILRSLVSMEDLEGVLGIRFLLPIPQQPSDHIPGLQPNHKMSIIIFLERVYGIPDQNTFFRLIETAFLPDLRCATILNSSSCSETDFALALNRYLCCSVLPLLTSYAHFFDDAEHKSTLMDSLLQTVYRLSKCKSLTTGQLDVVCDFLISLTNQLKAPMMKKLLRKLVVDLPTLSEHTIVPLKMLTIWYERCGRYYGASPLGNQASEEEKRLTMQLFTSIFDALAKRAYDPELFSKALPCLSAIGCALSPDYSHIVSSHSEQNANWIANEMGMNNQSGIIHPNMMQNPFANSSHLNDNIYEPTPINTSSIMLTGDYDDIIRNYAEHVHDYWCYNKFDQGWSCGELYDDANKIHPLLKPYVSLSKKEQQKYEDLIRETIKVIRTLGWTLDKAEIAAGNIPKPMAKLSQKKLKDGVVTNGYSPKPFDLTSITLTREHYTLAETISINCHELWAKKKKYELENVGAGLHHLLVPYDLLTDREKQKDLQFAQEFLKFLQSNGYRIQRMQQREDSDNGNNLNSMQIRFAYNLLEKLLQYVDKAAVNMQSIKESSRFSRKDSFKTSGEDVKFFTKVVLPLVERYFQAHRSYFILKSGSNKNGLGCASFKEKEMACSLFCKLAALLRQKISSFGSDANITVRCLQVLIRAVDVSSVMKNSSEIVRASLLPFFSHAGDDLNQVIMDLQANKLSNLKGTSQKGNASLDYVHMVLLPVLASMFDHLGVNKYGTEVLVGEIQLASYKILNALWILGTCGTKLIDREWIIDELNRHRPLLGECIGSFASCFPIAFLEPEFNSNNKHSIMYGLAGSNLSEHSLEAQDVMSKLSKNLPHLDALINELRELCESGNKYNEAPHVIEVVLPTICSYLNYWWNYGPSAREAQKELKVQQSVDQEKTPPPSQSTPLSRLQQDQKSNTPPVNQTTPLVERREESKTTNVTSSQMNHVLGYILKLINNNIDEAYAPWMIRIASFSQAIISNSTPDLLKKHFLPVSAKICEKASNVYNREISMKTTTRNVDSTEREAIENDLQKDFEILVRDLYAFYPLLIKYVDLHRAYWLKYPDTDSEQLYYSIAEVFTIWIKSKMFKREEVNFVSANDIDNQMLIMPSASSGGVSGSANVGGGGSSASGGSGAAAIGSSENVSNQSQSHAASALSGFQRGHGGKKKHKKNPLNKKFTSLIVACLKRLFQIGMNFFGGNEQELIQLSKQKFIDMKIIVDGRNPLQALTAKASANKPKAGVSSPSQTGSTDDNADLELTKDQEDLVEEFVRTYLKSPNYNDSIAANLHETSGKSMDVATIDKVSYKKNKWQRMLYRKIGSKRHLIASTQSLTEDELVERIMKIAKVLFGLHMVEHPQTKKKGVWRKLISGQRKKAVMACFRMAPLYSIPLHRAINLFVKSYKQLWLETEEESTKDIIYLIPDLCPQSVNESAESDVLAIKSNGEGETAAVEAKSEEAEPGAEAAEATEEPQRPDPLRQLISAFNRMATTEQTSSENGAGGNVLDSVYISFSEIMSKSCEIEEDDDEEEAGSGAGAEEAEEDQAKTFQEQEMEKQKLLFEQGRLAERGAAEMALLYISASNGEKTEMLEKTLQLGISLLHGGNTQVQARMLKHLKDKKDVGVFTSIAALMANCSVLDLDTFERCIKAEAFGGTSSNDSGSGMAGKKNLHDADFTCSLFRFLQLLCEGHNLEFQNYLRSQTGNNITVNIIICTVDYLLRLQESIMDFYWHYSGKSTVDAAGKDNFVRAITVAKQVFNTLTEYIQGPCVGNQLALAHSRLWDAIGGFLYIFAHLQDKLSKDPHQIELLRELMKLQKDMIIMLLSMLEGNVLNGPIGKQMVDTLIENQQNVEMLLKFFDIFLKMKDLTTSDAFQEFDTNGDGWISPKEFRKAMEAQKMYSNEEIDYILMCVDTNQDGKIDFMEFTERFHNPAKDIGFNMAVLLTNLSEHMSHDARLDRLMKKASSFLSYFEQFLGRIEITGSSQRIERVYFEIKESNIEQWNKPQIKESKRQFLYDIVNEGDDKEKLEQFVNFCEDTIFEMQHAASISSTVEGSGGSGGSSSSSGGGSGGSGGFMRKAIIDPSKHAIVAVANSLSPKQLKTYYSNARGMGAFELAKFAVKMFFKLIFLFITLSFHAVRLGVKCLLVMMSGQQEVKEQPQQTQSHDRYHDMNNSRGVLALTYSTMPPPPAPEQPTSDSATLTDEEHKESGDEEGGLHARAATPPLRTTATAAKPIIPEKYKYVDDSEEEILTEESGKHGSSGSSSSSKFNFRKNIMEMFARNFYKLKYSALVLAFLINFLMLFFKAIEVESGDGDAAGAEGAEGGEEVATEIADAIEVIIMDSDKYYLEYMLKALAFIHSMVAFAMMIAYYVLKVPLVIFKREKEIARKLEFDGMWIAEQPSDDDLRSHWDKLVLGTRAFPDMYWDKFVKKKVKSKYMEQFDLPQLCKLLGIDANSDEYKGASQQAGSAAKSDAGGLASKFGSIDWYYHIWKWGVIFTDNSFLYIFMYFVLSVIGNFNYFFFACHLVDVAVSIKTLTTILKSITHNGKQLLLTIMLMSIIVYMYTVIAFNFFRKFYAGEDEEHNCRDLFTCFKFHLYIGIRSGGGIGDELESPVGDQKEFYRIIFDITFFFFVIVILLAIIQGLIIDAFGELRDQLEQVKESLESNCFICGIGKDYFDKTPHGFEIHTMREHNFANYMFFLMHLINKPETEYTGQETYVWQLYQQRCWDFFPVGDCFRKQHEAADGDQG